MTRWQIKRYKLVTWCSLVVLIVIGFLLGAASGGFGAMFVMFLIYAYVQQRDMGLRELEWHYYEGEAGRVRTQCDEAIDVGKKFMTQQLLNNLYGFGIGKPVLCKTCQQGYDPDSFPYITECRNLRDVFPHNPHDEPPVGNPFRWYWFTVNGYRMPPDDWPMDKPWLSITAAAKEPITAMKQEGEEYYGTHRNPLWDAGFGEPPVWYVIKDQMKA